MHRLKDEHTKLAAVAQSVEELTCGAVVKQNKKNAGVTGGKMNIALVAS
jgi:hypothetical protein